MHLKKLLGLLGLAATAYAAAVPDTSSDGDPDSCTQDECLSALRIPWRLGQAKQDCGTWWVTTVTPPAVTVTATTTSGTTTTTTSSTTLTSTTTTTSTFSITSTATQSFTDVETSTSTSFTTVVTEAGSLQKRAAEGEADAEALPPYAGACNRAKYRSACACIGVHHKTVTAATPTVTATATATSTSTSTTVTTSSTTTTSTSLETTSVTSTTQTTTTTTTSVTSTQTATCSSFYIFVTYNDGTTGYVATTMTAASPLTIQSFKAGAQCWFLDATNMNTLTTARNSAQFIGAVNEPQGNTDPEQAHLDANSGTLPTDDVAITCNPSPGSNLLNCVAGLYTQTVSVANVLNFQPPPQQLGGGGNAPIPVTLSAVCCDP